MAKAAGLGLWSRVFSSLPGFDRARVLSCKIANPLKGNQVVIIELGVHESRNLPGNSFTILQRHQLNFAAEECVQILHRNLPGQQSLLAETPRCQPLPAAISGPGAAGEQYEALSANNLSSLTERGHKQTLSAIAKQDTIIHIYLSSKDILEDAKVLRVHFTSEMAPHPAFLTVRSINALVNINCVRGVIKGLTFSVRSKKTTIAIPRCLSLEGQNTSCGLPSFPLPSRNF
jgi:hypothetical protein